MSNSINALIVSIIAYVTEHDGYVTKTKLLKLLYLFDVEFYRAHGKTFTGFDWKYFHLGPWTREFDPILADLINRGKIVEQAAQRSDYDTKFLHTPDDPRPRSPFDNFKDQTILVSLLNVWGPSTTGEILDHVYFRTEPMEHGIRNELLDFSRVAPQVPATYKKTAPSKTPGEIKALRRAFDRKAAERAQPIFAFTKPNYDEEFLTAMEKLDTSEKL
jgi:hypothetical protein